MRDWVASGVLGLVLAWHSPVAADLAGAMGHIRAENWSAADREARQDGAVARAVVEWHRLRAAEGDFTDYLVFLKEYGDWPGMPLLLRRGEQQIPGNARASDVLAYFSDHKPQTGDGVLRLTAALEAQGRGADAQAEAVRAWRALRLSAQSESVLLARYGQALADHHVARLDNLLWEGRLVEAERMRSRVPEGHRKLLDARSALRRDAPGVDSYIAAVPASLRNDPGLAWERAAWRARKNRTDAVVELMLDRSASKDRLGRPEVWAKRRRSLSRQLMRNGQSREAYLLASQHHLTEGSDFADLEWLSGYIALRKLDNPAAALDHFRRFRAGVQSPISLGRAGYWEGRAHEAMGQSAAAAAAYAFGAEFQTSFYGQLAAEKAGLSMDPRMTGAEVFPGHQGAGFKDSSVYQAGLLLDEAGELALSGRFFAHLAESLSRNEIGQLTLATEKLNAPYIQLRIAKRAASAGHQLHRAYFPLMQISTKGRPDVSPEMALAIARRESEFNPVVVSSAGARGLMQVMPGTASDTSKALGVQYSKSRLTSDPTYNALLGTAYLQKLHDQFDNHPILVTVGYNAGPGRSRSWVSSYGHPERGKLDAVDWIEHIPFRETRNYVMRVTEALAPYRARLGGKTVPINLAAEIGQR